MRVPRTYLFDPINCADMLASSSWDLSYLGLAKSIHSLSRSSPKTDRSFFLSIWGKAAETNFKVSQCLHYREDSHRIRNFNGEVLGDQIRRIRRSIREDWTSLHLEVSRHISTVVFTSTFRLYTSFFSEGWIHRPSFSEIGKLIYYAETNQVYYGTMVCKFMESLYVPASILLEVIWTRNDPKQLRAEHALRSHPS
jgi:hypothetical protein